MSCRSAAAATWRARSAATSSPRRADGGRRAVDAESRAETPREPSSDPWRAHDAGAVRAGRRAHRAERRPPRLPRRAPATASYALPLDSLVAVAESAGLQWVNSDAAKIQAAQAAMAATAGADPRAARHPAGRRDRRRSARAGRDEEGPVAGQAAVRDDAARDARPLGRRGSPTRRRGLARGAFSFARALRQPLERALVGRRRA